MRIGGSGMPPSLRSFWVLTPYHITLLWFHLPHWLRPMKLVRVRMLLLLLDFRIGFDAIHAILVFILDNHKFLIDALPALQELCRNINTRAALR